jgi:hypothetical protein
MKWKIGILICRKLTYLQQKGVIQFLFSLYNYQHNALYSVIQLYLHD